MRKGLVPCPGKRHKKAPWVPCTGLPGVTLDLCRAPRRGGRFQYLDEEGTDMCSVVVEVVASKILFSDLGGSWVTTACMIMEGMVKVSEWRRMGGRAKKSKPSGTKVLNVGLYLF